MTTRPQATQVSSKFHRQPSLPVMKPPFIAVEAVCKTKPRRQETMLDDGASELVCQSLEKACKARETSLGRYAMAAPPLPATASLNAASPPKPAASLQAPSEGQTNRSAPIAIASKRPHVEPPLMDRFVFDATSPPQAVTMDRCSSSSACSAVMGAFSHDDRDSRVCSSLQSNVFSESMVGFQPFAATPTSTISRRDSTDRHHHRISFLPSNLNARSRSRAQSSDRSCTGKVSSWLHESSQHALLLPSTSGMNSHGLSRTGSPIFGSPLYRSMAPPSRDPGSCHDYGEGLGGKELRVPSDDGLIDVV